MNARPAPVTAEQLGLMQGSPTALGRQVTLANWQDSPFNRWAFQHLSEIIPSAIVHRGDGPVLPLIADAADFDGVQIASTGGILTLDEWLAATYTDGLIVLNGDRVLFEHYDNGMRPATRHLLMSISKSLCGALAGRFVARGELDPQQPVRSYVPELEHSAFGDATIQQMLDMAVALDFNEDYHDPFSHVQAQDRAVNWRPQRPGEPTSAYEFLIGLQRTGRHGERFQYCSAVTDALAWVLERVADRRYPQILEEELWSLIGVEHDATITVDRAGFGVANGGVSCTLRDLARFGRVVLASGDGPVGPVIPADWLAEPRAGGDRRLVQGTLLTELHPRGSYHNQWWCTGDADGCFYGVGIYGQYLWLNPAADVVIAKFSTLPKATDPDASRTHINGFRALTEVARQAI